MFGTRREHLQALYLRTPLQDIDIDVAHTPAFHVETARLWKAVEQPGSGSSREHQPKLALMIVPEFYVAEAALPESSVVQCGQRVALLGIDIWQAGQSFVTGGA
jgi:hypothetical protein